MEMAATAVELVTTDVNPAATAVEALEGKSVA